MKKFIFVFLSVFLYLSNIFAKDLTPNYSLKTSGGEIGRAHV